MWPAKMRVHTGLLEHVVIYFSNDCFSYKKIAHRLLWKYCDGTIFQAMYHLISVRNVFLSHFCYVDGCLTCEINLLFRLLTDQPSPNAISVCVGTFFED